MIQLTINGKCVSLDRQMSIRDFLAQRGLRENIVVVEHNYNIIPRDQYAAHVLGENDNVEIVQMMAGG